MKIFIYIVILFYISTFKGNVYGKGSSKIKHYTDSVLDQEEIVFSDQVYRETIKTVELYRSGWSLSFPYRNLRDTTTLVLEFDDLTGQPENFTYTLIHCNSVWEPTDMPESGFLDGLSEAEIRDYRFSRNTLQPYVHYSLAIPNPDIGFKISGNYLLFVYEDHDRERPVLTRRFCIIEPKVGIRADVHRTDNLDFLDSKQEIDFSVEYSRVPADNPARDFTVTILQNFGWNTAVTGLKPRYIHPELLIYDYEEENLFPGGSEFRHFDTKSLRFNSDRVAGIRFEKPIRHVDLKTDHPRDLNSYEYEQDLNGMYLVKWDDASDSDTEADYVMVHFALQVPAALDGDEVYLYGGLTDRSIGPVSRMSYDPVVREYSLDLLLKQGYYNYSYWVTGPGLDPVYPNPVEGSFFETENDYCIFVYYRDIRERFDRLVGLQTVSSSKSSGN